MTNEEIMKYLVDVASGFMDMPINRHTIACIQGAITSKLELHYANGDLACLLDMVVFNKYMLLQTLRGHMREYDYAAHLNLLEGAGAMYSLEIMHRSQYEQYVKDLIGNSAEQFLKEDK